MRYHALLVLAAAALLAGACSKDDKKKKEQADAAGGQTGDAVPADLPAEDAGPQPATDEPAADEPQGAEAGDEEADADAVKKILADCGGGDVATADPAKVIYQKTIESLLVVRRVLTVTITAKTELAIKVTGKTQEQDAKATIVKVEGLFAEAARAAAEQQAADTSGKSTLTNLPFADYLGLQEHKAWDGVVCSFVPVTKIDNQRGGKRTVASFDPPLPSSVSPRAVAERYEAEIGDGRVFEGLKVKVEQSDHPDLQGLTTLEGKVTVTKVPAKASVPNGSGGQVAIDADLAYKVTYDFGGPRATFALGFAPEVTFYISHEKRDLVANVIDTTAAGGGLAVFMHK